MINPENASRPAISFALEIADKVIKLIAVLLGGAWTYWNYKKSRTYSRRLELELTGDIFTKRDLYVNINAAVKNLGATQHSIQAAGTYCDLILIRTDLTEESVRLFPVFAHKAIMEPDESIHDTIYWRIPRPIDNIIWIKLGLRVIADKLEWQRSCLLRVEEPHSAGVFEEEVKG